jgi:hypothetical protein
MREPAMPCRNNDGLSTTSTRLRRASNCSEPFLRKRGQLSEPGINSRKCDNIWQPLQTPSAKLSPRSKNAWN